MKLIKKLIFAIICFIPMVIFASSSVSVDKTSLSIDEGGSVTFKITATSAAGKVTITSSDKSVVTVDKSSEWIENETITVKVTGINIGSTTINVVIDGAGFDESIIKTTKTISVKVNAPKSSNNNLNDLKINDITIDGFSSSKTSYSYSTNDSNVMISASTEDSKAKVSGTGSKKLSYGKNKYNIKVTAENGKTKTYVVTINKNDGRSSNNYLNSLTVSDGTISFDKSTTLYTIEVNESQKEITIDATVEDNKSKVSGTGTKVLDKEINEFKVVVTAENGNTKTYTINVVKKVNNEVENKYTLTYDEESYKFCSKAYSMEIEMDENSAWGTLCSPVREGYSFVGWFTEEEGGEEITEESIAKSNITIYAHFEKINNNIKTGSSIVIIISILSFLLGNLFAILAMRLYKDILKRDI